MFYLCAVVSFFTWEFNNFSTSWAIKDLIVITIPLFIDIFIELWGNFTKYLNNEEINRVRVKILNRNGLIEESRSGKLRVGQIIKIENNEVIPADLVILSTSSNKGSKQNKNLVINNFFRNLFCRYIIN